MRDAASAASTISFTSGEEGLGLLAGRSSLLGPVLPETLRSGMGDTGLLDALDGTGDALRPDVDATAGDPEARILVPEPGSLR